VLKYRQIYKFGDVIRLYNQRILLLNYLMVGKGIIFAFFKLAGLPRAVRLWSPGAGIPPGTFAKEPPLNPARRQDEEGDRDVPALRKIGLSRKFQVA
jgi:hypothetical protein